MSDQNDSVTTLTPAAESTESQYSQDWLDSHRTTAAEQETAQWIAGRNQEIVATRALKQALGQDYEPYRNQVEALSSDERLDLIDKSPEEITAHLDDRAEADRLQKARADADAQQAKDQAEARFRETAELRQVRHAMKSAYQQATSLDDRIAELQRLNDMRDDISAKGWDDLSTEDWRAAREGKMESKAGEIAALIQAKQAALQEAALHQSAYHEGARATQAPQGYAPPANTPIGQIVGQNGQPMQFTRADIATIVQLERDDQAHEQRAAEARKVYPDWDQVWRNAGDLPIESRQMAFIKSLPNSADVAYYLASHHNEAMALARMPSHEATRALIWISHQAARPSSPPERTKTSAPKPPSPVSGSSSRGFDVNDESISNDDWMHKRNADLQRRGKL